MTPIAFSGHIWRYPGESGWRFVTVPQDLSEEIRERFGQRAGGFGSLKVRATIGNTSWETSIFPDTKLSAYLLPVKAAVRNAEGLSDDAIVTVSLHIL